MALRMMFLEWRLTRKVRHISVEDISINGSALNSYRVYLQSSSRGNRRVNDKSVNIDSCWSSNRGLEMQCPCFRGPAGDVTFIYLFDNVTFCVT